MLWLLTDLSLIDKESPVAGVFLVRVAGRYQLNYHEARKVCPMLGATLATYEQLDVAYRHGMQMCRYVYTEGSLAEL